MSKFIHQNLYKNYATIAVCGSKTFIKNWQSIQNCPSKFCANIVNLLKCDNTVINLCGYVNVIVLYTNLTVVPGNLSITLSVHKYTKIGCVHHEIWILKLQFCNLSDFKNTTSDWCYDGDYSCNDTSTNCDCRHADPCVLCSSLLVPLIIWELGSLASMLGDTSKYLHLYLNMPVRC